MDYPFIRCLHPKFITNRYTGKEVLIECGKCESCMMKKSLTKTTLCKLESLVHKYMYFVTLTFDNDNLPLAQLQCTNLDLNTYDVVRVSDCKVLGSVYFEDVCDKINLTRKCNTPNNHVPILDYSLVQKFLKRLRKRLEDYEKIRYFVCGEYGPVHFRPHFHLLFWFDEEQTSARFIESVRACWSHGRVDVSLSKGKSCSYVASYVNCNQYLPRVFKLHGTSPLSHHSVYVGEQFYQSEVQKPSEVDYEGIKRKRIFFNGFNSDVFLWRSLKARIFPKLKGFASQSEHERVLTYSAYAVARDWTQETRPLDLAKFITDYVKYEDFYHPNDTINDFLQLLRYGLNYYESNKDTNEFKLVRPTLVDYDKFQRMVYVLLLQSRRFLKHFCGGNDSYSHVKYCVSLVDKFYKDLDYDGLKQQFQNESDLSKEGKRFDFMFHNKLIVKDYKESREYKNFFAQQCNRFSTFTKHKELNDLNKIFVY